jgi:hypothetical protein
MSSSNLVKISIIKEATYGVTPVAGDFDSVRFVSESLSGTPGTTESKNIRTDRQSSGQVVTSLTVGGDLALELAKDPVIDDIIQSAMLSAWSTSAAVTVDLTLDATAKTLTRSTGDFTADLAVGDVITLAGFTDSIYNSQVMVSALTTTNVIAVVLPDTMIAATATGATTTYQLADKIAIGTTKTSFSMEKQFTDLTTKAINYRGMLVGELNSKIAYGEIVSMTAKFSGNDYDVADIASEFMTNTRTVNDAATTNSLNGSVDMPFLADSSGGTLTGATFCIQNVEINLNNNLNAQTCIGEVSPQNYTPGQASVGVNLTAYLADANWTLLAKKLTQDPFSIGFMVKNSGGWYGFYMPAIQVSFDDPASPGANQDIMLSMKGVGKVGASGESALTIYKMPS